MAAMTSFDAEKCCHWCVTCSVYPAVHMQQTPPVPSP